MILRKLKHKAFNRLRTAICPSPESRDVYTTKPSPMILNKAVIVDVSGGLCNQMMCYKAARMISDWNDSSIVIVSKMYDDLKQNAESHTNFQLHFYPIRYDLLFLGHDAIDLICDANSIFRVTREMLFCENGDDRLDAEGILALKERLKSCKVVWIDIWFSLLVWRRSDLFKLPRGVIAELTLEPSGVLNSRDSEILSLISKCGNPVALHVRRGDFLNPDNDLAVDHGYYIKAIGHLREQVDDAVFFVFSDDIAWCRSVFRECNAVVYVDHNPVGSGHLDLYLASCCRHFILTGHSTFSHHMVELNRANQGRISISNGMEHLHTQRDLKSYHVPEHCVLLTDALGGC